MIDIFGEGFEIEKIVNYLKPYTSIIDSSYNWDTPSNEQIIEAEKNQIFSINQGNELIAEKNMFERNVLLKKVLFNNLGSTQSIELKKHIFKWIVNIWGGINVRDIDKLYTSVASFLSKHSEKQKIDIDGISSVSKILSFICPHKYIIYDARVAYSVNWILLKANASNKFFPMPESRNSKLAAIDISTLIRLSKLDNYKNNIGNRRIISNSDKEIFINKSMAYITLCELIKKVNNELWENDKKRFPFYTEMLVFSLADNVIFSDILNFCNLKIS